MMIKISLLFIGMRFVTSALMLKARVAYMKSSQVQQALTDTREHSLLMRHKANQWCYLSPIICFQLRHITSSVISALFMSDFHTVRKHGTERHKSAQITLNLFLSVLVLLKDFLK